MGCVGMYIIGEYGFSLVSFRDVVFGGAARSSSYSSSLSSSVVSSSSMTIVRGDFGVWGSSFASCTGSSWMGSSGPGVQGLECSFQKGSATKALMSDSPFHIFWGMLSFEERVRIRNRCRQGPEYSKPHLWSRPPCHQKSYLACQKIDQTRLIKK